MVKSKFVRISAAAVTSLGLVAGMTGLAAASTNGSDVSGTGDNSSTKVISKNHTNNSVSTKTHLYVSNDTDQHATSGSAKVHGNGTGGNAKTGDVANDNTTGTDVSVAASSASGMSDSMDPNGSSNDSSVADTGENSSVVVVSKNSTSNVVKTDTSISVNNNVDQSAHSGSASTSHNGTGGNATSGDSSNTSHTSTSISVE